MTGLKIASTKKNAVRRFLEMIVFTGIPSVVLELIFTPRNYWIIDIIFLVPAVVIGLAVATVFEGGLIRYIRNHMSDNDDHE